VWLTNHSLPVSFTPRSRYVPSASQLPQNLAPPFLAEPADFERAAVTKITGHIFMTLPIICSNAGYPCSGSRSGCIFSQM